MASDEERVFRQLEEEQEKRNLLLHSKTGSIKELKNILKKGIHPDVISEEENRCQG